MYRLYLNNDDELTVNEREVLVRLMVGEKPSAIAKSLGITRQRVCQLRKAGSLKTRTGLRETPMVLMVQREYFLTRTDVPSPAPRSEEASDSE